MSIDERLSALGARPWVIGAVLLCTTGTLGVVAVSASPPHIASRAAGVGDVFRLNPGVVTTWYAVGVAMATAAALAVLWWVRNGWPWLVLAGAVLTIPAELIDAMPTLYLSTGQVRSGGFILALRPAAAQLLLLGVLAGGVRLMAIRPRGAGALLIGCAFGAQVFGASLDVRVGSIMILPGPRWDLSPFVHQLLHDGMIVVALGAAMLVMVLHRFYGDRPELSGPDDPRPDELGPGTRIPDGSRPDSRTVIAGGAAALVFVPVTVLWAEDQALSAAGYAALLLAGLVCAAVAGARVFAGTAVATLVVTGISGPAGALMLMQPGRLVLMWFLVGVSVLVGAALAFPPWRTWSAAAVCAFAGQLLLAVILLKPDWSRAHDRLTPLLLLVVLVIAATAVVAVVGTWRPMGPAAPVVLGPLLTATVIGACGLLARWQGTGRRGPGWGLFGEPRHLVVYAALLLGAAVFVTASAMRTGPFAGRGRDYSNESA
jgi:hypothetical protein